MANDIALAALVLSAALSAVALGLQQFVETRKDPWVARQAASRMTIVGIALLVVQVVHSPPAPLTCWALTLVFVGSSLTSITRAMLHLHMFDTLHKIDKRTPG